MAWVDGKDLVGYMYALQVSAYDGNTNLPLASAGWVEAYNDAHIYTAPFLGGSQQLGLFIWDDYYSDNVGGITVDIYKVNW